MNLDAIKLGLATAIIFGVAWTICSLFVIMAPGGMMQMSWHMVHSNFESMGWSLHLTGFFVGLVTWIVFLGLLPLPIIAYLPSGGGSRCD
jgi:membrane associated rhomboid family serine protease